jgi:hypothetical protein
LWSAWTADQCTLPPPSIRECFPFTPGAIHGWSGPLATTRGSGRVAKFGANSLKARCPRPERREAPISFKSPNLPSKVPKEAPLLHRANAESDFGNLFRHSLWNFSSDKGARALPIQLGSSSATIARSSFNSLTVASTFALANSLRGTSCTTLILAPSDRVGNEQIRPFSMP